MASTKLAFLGVAVAVLLQQVSWCAVAEDALMALTSISNAKCDGKPHSDKDLFAAMSTGWFNRGSMCNKKIRITNSENGRKLVAEVVDECDTESGCKDNMIATSKAVWDKLGLNTDIGVVSVTWSIA